MMMTTRSQHDQSAEEDDHPPKSTPVTKNSTDHATITTHTTVNLAPFNPSSETAQLQSLALMDLRSDDVLFDLGCGDGRLLIRAVTQVPGLICIGIEMDPVFVERARKAMVQQLPPDHDVQTRIQVRCQDVNQVLAQGKDESTGTPDATTTTNNNNKLDNITIYDATVIYLYLLPRGLRQIKPMLDQLVARRLHDGANLRFVAYTFQVPGWEPERVDTSTKSGVPIYFYRFSKD